MAKPFCLWCSAPWVWRSLNSYESQARPWGTSRLLLPVLKLATSLMAVTTYLTRILLKEGRDHLSHREYILSPQWKVWKLEAAGHLASRVRKQRGRMLAPSLLSLPPFSLLIQSGSLARWWQVFPVLLDLPRQCLTEVCLLSDSKSRHVDNEDEPWPVPTSPADGGLVITWPWFSRCYGTIWKLHPEDGSVLSEQDAPCRDSRTVFISLVSLCNKHRWKLRKPQPLTAGYKG